MNLGCFLGSVNLNTQYCPNMHSNQQMVTYSSHSKAASPAVTVPTSPEGTELAQCPQVPTSGHSASVPVNMCVCTCVCGGGGGGSMVDVTVIL